MEVLPADVTVSEANNGNNLVLTFAGSTDKITISSAISTPQFRIEQVSFADGTNWSYADLLAKATTPTAGNDVLYGDETVQTLQGAAGNDKLYGRAGDDILIGGTGNDYLNGGPGNDTYIFQSGDRNDVIDDVRSAVSFNTVQLGTGITPDNTVISTSANGLDIVIGFVGSTDTITVSYMNISSGNGIDQIQFADGSSWSYADIMARGAQSRGGSDAVTGTSSAAFVRDLGGDDQLSGLGGDDQVLGDAGNDDLTGDGGNDILGRGAAAPAFDGAPSTGGQQLLPTIASDDTPPVLGHVQHEWLWQQFDVPVAKKPISSLSTNDDASRAGMVGRSAAMLSESISAFSPSSSFLDTEGQRVERQPGEWAFSAPLATTSPRPLLGL